MRTLGKIAAFAMLLVGSSLALADDLPLVKHVDGYPAGFHKGEVASYAVWHHKDGGWHIAVTTAGHRHHFKGRVWIEGEGKFGEIKQWKGEGEKIEEAVRDNWFHKAIKRGPKDREFSFDIVGEGGCSGVFFEVEGPGPLKWQLGIGGPGDKETVEENPAWIKMGSEGKNPPAVPFATMAHPDEKGHGH